MSATEDARLEMRGIDKSFGSNRVLSGVDFVVPGGAIVALLGTNGAGKSTLIKILCGVHAADAGEIRLDGESVAFRSPVDAIHAGVRVLPQEISVVPELSVAENILLDRLPTRRLLGLQRLDRDAMREAARRLAARVGLDADADTPVGALTVQQMRLVEIARALAGEARVLILDEPTASMSQKEADELFANLDRLRRDGTSIIYISHYLDEVFRLSDEIVVLRDGVIAGRFTPGSATQGAVLAAMLGRELDQLFPEPAHAAPQAGAVLGFEAVVIDGSLGPLSFELRPGEILGMFGLLGSGVERLAPAVFGGVGGVTGGRVVYDGGPLPPTSGARIAAGIGYVPAERKRDGIVPDMAILDNVCLPFISRFERRGVLRPGAMRAHAGERVDLLSVRCQGLDQPLRELSGGNQQKVCLARWIDPAIRVLVLEEPTRGVDMGARQDIYREIRQLADSGMAVLMISSDVDEIAGCSDRSLVLVDGRIAGEYPARTHKETLMGAAARAEDVH